MITASNDWSSCQLQDTITTAGEYYNSTLDSGSAQLSCSDAYLSVSGTATSTTTWTISARLQQAVPNMTLELIRAGSGTGDSIPVGGDSYIPQSTAYQTLFTGQGDISSIPLRFRISHFGVNAGHGAHHIGIEYQITAD